MIMITMANHCDESFWSFTDIIPRGPWSHPNPYTAQLDYSNELHPCFQLKLLLISSTMLSKLKKCQVKHPSIPFQKRKNTCHYNILSDIHDSIHCRNWLQDINKNKGVFVVDWLNHLIKKVLFKGSMNIFRHKATKNWDFGILNHQTWLLASSLEKVLLEKFSNVSYPLMTRWNWQ